jgi:hypothetical protein
VSGIGPEGAKHVAEGLKGNRTLKTLDLSSCFIRNDGAEYIAEALKVNQTLQTLNLACLTKTLLSFSLTTDMFSFFHLLTVNSIQSEGAKKIAEALKVNATLLNLSLCRKFFFLFLTNKSSSQKKKPTKKKSKHSYWS